LSVRDLQLVEAVASVATVIGVFFAAWQIGLVKRQSKTTFEDSLSREYRTIMETIPLAIWLGAELKALSQEQQDRCRDAIYRYIDLSNGLYGRICG